MKEKAEPEPEPEPEKPKEEKKKDPFAHLPPPKMVFDEWKKKYRNTDTEKEAIPWFWQNIDREGSLLYDLQLLKPCFHSCKPWMFDLLISYLSRFSNFYKKPLKVLGFGNFGNSNWYIILEL